MGYFKRKPSNDAGARVPLAEGRPPNEWEALVYAVEASSWLDL